MEAIQRAEEQTADLENMMGLMDRKVNVTDQKVKITSEQLEELKRSSDVS